MQYIGWVRLGSRRATDGSPEARRLALRRWVAFAVAWQVAVLVFAGVYVGVMSRGAHSGGAWIAPAVGVVVGTALPLQAVVMGLLRTLR